MVRCYPHLHSSNQWDYLTWVVMCVFKNIIHTFQFCSCWTGLCEPWLCSERIRIRIVLVQHWKTTYGLGLGVVLTNLCSYCQAFRSTLVWRCLLHWFSLFVNVWKKVFTEWQCDSFTILWFWQQNQLKKFFSPFSCLCRAGHWPLGCANTTICKAVCCPGQMT